MRSRVASSSGQSARTSEGGLVKTCAGLTVQRGRVAERTCSSAARIQGDERPEVPAPHEARSTNDREFSQAWNVGVGFE